MRVNRGQEFIIGGFVPGSLGVESIILGYYEEKNLVYVAKIKNGFVPLTRRKIFEKLTKLANREASTAMIINFLAKCLIN